MVKDALEAGAIGYILKSVSIDRLAEAIHSAALGQPTLSPEATLSLVKSKTGPLELNPDLTAREKQVLALMREPMERAGSDPAIMARSIHDHERVVDALRQGSIPELREVMLSHLRVSITNIQSVIGQS